MFFINLYTSIDRFLIRTCVKYPEILKGNGPLLNLIMTLITMVTNSSLSGRLLYGVIKKDCLSW
jgi:hypothetical protein